MIPSSVPNIFADTFTIRDLAHQRCAKPSGPLAPQLHLDINLPASLGKAHLDVYIQDNAALFSRLYHVATGQFAWYQVTPIAPSDPLS